MQQSECPICAGRIPLSDTVEVSEMLACPECGNKVVVKAVEAGSVILAEAPKVEEDWGE